MFSWVRPPPDDRCLLTYSDCLPWTAAPFLFLRHDTHHIKTLRAVNSMIHNIPMPLKSHACCKLLHLHLFRPAQSWNNKDFIILFWFCVNDYKLSHTNSLHRITLMVNNKNTLIHIIMVLNDDHTTILTLQCTSETNALLQMNYESLLICAKSVFIHLSTKTHQANMLIMAHLRANIQSHRKICFNSTRSK